MSPTENDLRAALRDGEGDGPDPYVVAAAGRRAAARRRTQLVNTAAAVVLVAAVGTGGTFLLRDSGDDARSNSAAANGGAAKAPTAQLQLGAGSSEAANARREASGATAPAPAAPIVRVECPASVSVSAPPAANGDTASGPFFRATPDALTICTYAGPSATPTRTLLTGAEARAVAASLESAPTKRPGGLCPDYRIAGERTVEIIGTAAGKPVGSVRTTLDRPACATVVTNGTIVRFGWTPPAPLLRRLGPIGGRSHGPVAQSSLPSK